MKDVDQGQDEIAGLVQACQTGDKAAFDRLVLLHQRQAVGLAFGILGNREDAAEVAQEAFLKAHLGLAGLSQPGRFRFWLLKIVANEAVSRRRAARRPKRDLWRLGTLVEDADAGWADQPVTDAAPADGSPEGRRE